MIEKDDCPLVDDDPVTHDHMVLGQCHDCGEEAFLRFDVAILLCWGCAYGRAN